MQPGTRTLLFGSHQLLIHPVMVAYAWWKLYHELPVDPRLLMTIVVHDWGLWGLPNIDGPEGDLHPALGGRIMDRFGKCWGDMARGHSRYYSRHASIPLSKLCAADKLASGAWWPWLYVLLSSLSGEIEEYMRLTDRSNGESKYVLYDPEYPQHDRIAWYREVAAYLRTWAYKAAPGLASGSAVVYDPYTQQ
jgi:hypothetical protein